MTITKSSGKQQMTYSWCFHGVSVVFRAAWVCVGVRECMGYIWVPAELKMWGWDYLREFHLEPMLVPCGLYVSLKCVNGSSIGSFLIRLLT